VPNRILKESICVSDTINSLSLFEEVCFYRLIVICDDYGRMDARASILKSRMFPLRDVRKEQIDAAIRSLSLAGLVILYEVDGKPFVQLTGWAEHQRLRNAKPRFPQPVNDFQQPAASCGEPPQAAASCGQNPNPNPNPESQSQLDIGGDRPHTPARFIPPTLEEVTAYCKERNNNVDPSRFLDFYASKGWVIGKSKMKDWKAAVRTWERNDNAGQQATTNPFLRMLQEDV
jgi:hypothetical protein